MNCSVFGYHPYLSSDYQYTTSIGSIYTRNAAFTSRSDTVTSGTNNQAKETKKGLSKIQNFGLGVLALAGIGITICILGRGAGTKSVQEVVEPAEFKNISEAKDYFEKLGIKAVFKNGTENHLTDLNAIKKDLTVLENNGVKISKPDIIVFADWSKKAELEETLGELNLNNNIIKDIVQTLNNNSCMWGTVDSVKGKGNIVFVNNGFNSNLRKFIHEMGHLHQDLETSFWHSKGLIGDKFRQKQYEILGLEMPENLASLNRYSNWSNQSLDDIFRTSCNGGCHISDNGLKQRINNLFPELNGNFETVFFVPTQNSSGGIDAYYINAKKMLEKMHSESRVYASDKTFENVAEIFQGLNQGKTYSDEVMLMYDFCGGGRVPNLVIKGKKYDDYIQSLYENKDLVETLRNCLNIQKLL